MSEVSADVQSVNEEKPKVEDNAAEGEPWVDPVYLDQNPERLSDEPEPTPEEIAAKEAEEAAAAEAERKKSGKPTKAELKKLIEELPDDDDDDADPDAAKDGADAEKARKAEEAETDDEEDEDDDADEGKAAAEEAGKDEAGKPKRRRRSNARRERRAMQRRIDSLEREITQLRAGGAPAGEGDGEEGAEQARTAAEAADGAQETPPPKLDDYETADQWAEAMAKWTRQEVDAGRKRAEEAERRKAAEEAHQEALRAFDERCEEMRDRHEDFDEVVHAEDLRISPAMAEVIRDSDVGPQMAYHLGTNPEEAAKIAGLSPLHQAKALARLEARLEAEEAERSAAEEAAAEETDTAGKAKGAEQAKPTETQPQQRRPATKAPAPPPRLSGGAAHSRNADNMGMDEYAEARRTGKIR